MSKSFKDPSRYLFSFGVDTEDDKVPADKCSKVYRAIGEPNHRGCTCWIIRCALDEQNNIKFDDTKNNSIELRDEGVQAVHEYAVGKMIVSIVFTDLLLVHNWNPYRYISRVEPGNCQKFFFEPLPNFDEEKFPFLLCSGYESYTLINVKEGRSEVLIDASCNAMRAQ